MTTLFDAIVVGGGPAGLSAATWLGRYRRATLVIDSGEYRNRWVRRSHGYLGSDPHDPMELLDRARRDLSRYPFVTLCRGEAVTAARDERGRFVVGVGNEEFVGLRLVLATGTQDRFPEVDGFFDHYGTSVFHCSSCDGYEAQRRTVVVLGWGEHVSGFALGLLDWVSGLTVVTQGQLAGDDRQRGVLLGHGVRVVEGEAAALVGEPGRLEAVRLRDGNALDADLVFFSIAHLPRLRLADQLGCTITEESCLLVDAQGQTTVPGLYAAGDITPGFQLASVAAGKGATAGVACALSLQGERGAPSSPTPAPDPEAELPA